jgi:Cu(I)/Ag(I) efflux system membrane fusion protein
MKFILKIIKTLFILSLLIAMVVTAFWFLNDQDTREEWYNKTVAQVTGKTFDESFDYKHDHNHSSDAGTMDMGGSDAMSKKLTMDDVKNDTVPQHSKRHSDPNYVCPMHPQIVKGEEGNCPICGMDLVLNEQAVEEPKKDTGEKKEKKILYWVAPMDANYRRDEPGKSLMGMDLVPVYDEGASDDDGDGLPKITINASTAQNMGVRIEKAKMKELSRTINTIGSVTYNEDNLHHVHARANGWVEKVYANSLGDPVEKGKALLEFYSPDILAAQKDLVIANRAGSSLGKVSRTRLRDLNVPKSVIDRVSRTGKSQNRIPIVANHTGVVTKIGIKNGMYITPSTEIYTIADLSSVWIIVDVFEHQLTWVKVGNKAEIQVQGVPSKIWEGKVDYIYPELSPKTRTLKVRLTIDTPKQLLKPNMFADVTLFTKDKKALTVPAESIIYYENSPRLVKVVAENKYQPIEVKIGMKSNGKVEILEGIEEGDEILVSGQFMIDSESNLQASFRRMSGK